MSYLTLFIPPPPSRSSSQISASGDSVGKASNPVELIAEKVGSDPGPNQALADLAWRTFNPHPPLSLHKTQREWTKSRGTHLGGGGGSTTAPTPARLFEHFLIVVRVWEGGRESKGEHNTNLISLLITSPLAIPIHAHITQGLAPEDAPAAEAAVDAAAARGRSDEGGATTPAAPRAAAHGAAHPPTLPPRLLHCWPGPSASARPPPAEAPAFCFPHGVPVSTLKRSPSDSALAAAVFAPAPPPPPAWVSGGGGWGAAAAAAAGPAPPGATFVFALQSSGSECGDADTATTLGTLYGVCVYAADVVTARPTPAVVAGGGPAAGGGNPFSSTTAARRLAAAPRCYCLLTRHPFLALHAAFLHDAARLERLARAAAWEEAHNSGAGASRQRSLSPPQPPQQQPPPPPPVVLADGTLAPPPPPVARRASVGPHSEEEDGSEEDAPLLLGSVNGKPKAPAPVAAQRAPSVPAFGEEEGAAAAAVGLAAAVEAPPLAALPTPPPPPPAAVTALRSSSLQRASDRISRAAAAAAAGSGGAGSGVRLPPPPSTTTTAAAAAPLPPPSPPPPSARPRAPGPPSTAAWVAAYAGAPVPAPGAALVWDPFPGVAPGPLAYRRPPASAASALLPARPGEGEGEEGGGARRRPFPRAVTAAAECAACLAPWAVAVAAAALPLDALLTFLSAALLEVPAVVFCPDLATLSACVLAVGGPLLAPFQWQSLLLPVLPVVGAAAGGGGGAGGSGGAAPSPSPSDDHSAALLSILDAPVPFIAGLQYKTPAVAARCGGLVRVNVYKGRVSVPPVAAAHAPGGEGGGASAGHQATSVPPIPGREALTAALTGPHRALVAATAAAAAPGLPPPAPGDVSPAQAAAAAAFAAALRSHLAGLFAALPAHVVTEISSGGTSAATPDGGRTSVVLKESLVDSFPPRDQAWARGWVETQLFAAAVDAVLE